MDNQPFRQGHRDTVRLTDRCMVLTTSIMFPCRRSSLESFVSTETEERGQMGRGREKREEERRGEGGEEEREGESGATMALAGWWDPAARRSLFNMKKKRERLRETSLFVSVPPGELGPGDVHPCDLSLRLCVSLAPPLHLSLPPPRLFLYVSLYFSPFLHKKEGREGTRRKQGGGGKGKR